MDIRDIYTSVFSKQLDFIDKLDPKYITAIKKYTASDYYENLNRFMCAGLPLSETYETIYNDLMHVFNTVPRLSEPVVVWRGLRAPKLDKARLSCQFVSTSLSVQAATLQDFVGSVCCVLKITLPAGASVLPIEFQAEQDGEWEVLLPPNGDWVVLSSENLPYTDAFSRTKTIKTYYITYIPMNKVVLDNTIDTSRNLLKLTDDENSQRILRAVVKDDFELLYDGVVSEENVLSYIEYIANYIGALPLPPIESLYQSVLKVLE
jgi:hypothetical protein